MISGLPTRREVASRLLPRLAVLGLCTRSGALFAQAEKTTGAIDRSGLTHNCECIHQEEVIRASRDRVYRALTDERQFTKVTELSYHDTSTEISQEVGGAFSIFGGLITGRHIEMVPNELLVQAWREKPWTAGVYSIVRFKLQDAGSATKIIFDHTGFPRGAGEHLASGWRSHYWEPLQKYLG
ncbi:MAG: SRPBCC domain-containing protein [Terriglobales bacterium]